MNRINILLVLFLFSLFSQGQVQQLEIGEWRAHVPFDKANSVTLGNGHVFCASEGAFTSYNPQSFELKRFTTINGLSDIGIQMIEFNQYTNTLVIAYKNGNIDLMEGSSITNISSVKDANVIGDKGIYNIRFEQELAYLSCGFGVVVLNVARKEIKDTYNPDTSVLKVNDVYIHQPSNQIYAATDQGIYAGDLSKNLADYGNWNKDTNFPQGQYTLVEGYANYVLFNQRTKTYDADVIWGLKDGVIRAMTEFGVGGVNHFQVNDDQLIISKYFNAVRFDNTLTQLDLIYTYDANGTQLARPSECIYNKGKYWIADQTRGLVEYEYAGSSEFHTPNGPNTLSINHMDIFQGEVWTASGVLKSNYREASNLPEFNYYKSLQWTGKDRENDDKLDSIYGFIKIKVNPFNPSQVFSGSWNSGLLEFRDGEIFNLYDYRNANEHSLSPVINTDLIRIGGFDFDRSGNLWIGNSEVPYALSVFQPSTAAWKSYFLGNYVDDFTIVGEVLVAENGYKWILLNRNGEIIVFDDNGTLDNTLDDRSTILTPTEGRGSIPGSIVNCIVQDKGGNIWIGTNEGPAVFYNPNSALDTGANIQAQRIFVQQEGQTQILLETENIRTIAIDGANRKWFGSTNSGAYLMSADATVQINHFTNQNSPLFSDDIKYIDIDGESGEVYFCTAEGLISYRGTATEGKSGFGEVQVFPNPVQRGYSGLIAIKGLAENANVKITDVNGVLVYETFAQGGQATWDGRSLNGSQAHNGVYLIFSSSASGDSQSVTKLLYLKH